MFSAIPIASHNQTCIFDRLSLPLLQTNLNVFMAYISNSNFSIIQYIMIHNEQDREGQNSDNPPKVESRAGRGERKRQYKDKESKRFQKNRGPKRPEINLVRTQNQSNPVPSTRAQIIRYEPKDQLGTQYSREPEFIYNLSEQPSEKQTEEAQNLHLAPREQMANQWPSSEASQQRAPDTKAKRYQLERDRQFSRGLQQTQFLDCQTLEQEADKVTQIARLPERRDVRLNNLKNQPKFQQDPQEQQQQVLAKPLNLEEMQQTLKSEQGVIQFLKTNFGPLQADIRYTIDATRENEEHQLVKLLLDLIVTLAKSKVFQEHSQIIVGILSSKRFKDGLLQYLYKTYSLCSHSQEVDCEFVFALSSLLTVYSNVVLLGLDDLDLQLNLLEGVYSKLRGHALPDLAEELNQSFAQIKEIYQIQFLERAVLCQEQISTDNQLRYKAEFEAIKPDYKFCPVEPTLEDFSSDLKYEFAQQVYGKIHPLNMKYQYPSAAHFMNNHFYILREDCYRGFRQAIHQIKQRRGFKNLRDSVLENVYLYYNVAILDICVKKGVELELRMTAFEPEAGLIVSGKLQRLRSGSLLALATAQASSFLFMVSKEREEDIQVQVQKGDAIEVRVGLLGTTVHEQVQALKSMMLDQQPLYVIENKVYFEPYFHYLSCIQKMDETKIAFEDHIVYLKKEVLRPQYLLGHLPLPSIEYKINLELCPIPDKPSQALNILDPDWPNDVTQSLDDAQVKAIQLILTHKIALVQGPPGTGKTFCGAMAIKNLIMNKSYWKPKKEGPILIVCHTNHALDQILRHISKVVSMSEIVRVGGRCSDESLANCVLQNIISSSEIQLHYPHRREYRDLQKQLNSMLSHVIRPAGEVTFSSFLYNCPDHMEQIVKEYLNREGLQFSSSTLSISSQELIYDLWINTWQPQDSDCKKIIQLEEEDSNHLTQERKSKQPWKVIPRVSNSAYQIPLARHNQKIDLILQEDEEQQNQSREGSNLSEIEEDYQAFEGENELEQESDEGFLKERLNSETEDTVLEQDEVNQIDVQVENEIQFQAQSEEGNDISQLQQQPEDDFQTFLRPKPPQSDDDIDYNSDSDLEDNDEEMNIDEYISDFGKMTRHYKKIQMKLRKGFSIWDLQSHERIILASLYCGRNAKDIDPSTSHMIERYRQLDELFHDAIIQRDLGILKKRKIVGMTVTGCAKFAKYINSLRSRIMLIEEAAEVLESHTAVLLQPKLEHLILIGDHQQLRPKLASYFLETKFQANSSLFERLISNDLPHVTLTHQRRMKSEFADFIRLIYGNSYQDHSQVLEDKNTKSVPGMLDSLVFFNHNQEESQYDRAHSKSNKFEAEMACSLAKYLVDNFVDQAKITILSFYERQVSIIWSILQQLQLTQVLVSTIDNYQGEENDIILLSLVRSNSAQKIGFVWNDNRVCVALSRARIGFYVFGNFDFIENVVKKNLNIGMQKYYNTSSLWVRIIDLARRKGILKSSLATACLHGRQSQIVTQQDWGSGLLGRCQLRCEEKFKPCGHECGRMCHQGEHLQAFCTKPCKQELSCGHQCLDLCSQIPCPPCKSLITKELGCGHQQLIACSNTGNILCKLPCERNLVCGHKCQKLCHQSCSEAKCNEMVSLMLSCKHAIDVPCKDASRTVTCTKPCAQALACGHVCESMCGLCCSSLHSPCQKECNKVLPCGHICRKKCSTPCSPCVKLCRSRCCQPCNHPCQQPCTPCNATCSAKCYHGRCNERCGRLCSRKPCNFRCRELLKCGCQCLGLCGEDCPQICNNVKHEYYSKRLWDNFLARTIGNRLPFLYVIKCKRRHIFTVSQLDARFRKQASDPKQFFLTCPICNHEVLDGGRYKNLTWQMRERLNKYRADELRMSCVTFEEVRETLSQVQSLLRRVKQCMREGVLSDESEISMQELVLNPVFKQDSFLDQCEAQLQELIRRSSRGGGLSFQRHQLECLRVQLKLYWDQMILDQQQVSCQEFERQKQVIRSQYTRNFYLKDNVNAAFLKRLAQKVFSLRLYQELSMRAISLGSSEIKEKCQWMENYNFMVPENDNQDIITYLKERMFQESLNTQI